LRRRKKILRAVSSAADAFAENGNVTIRIPGSTDLKKLLFIVAASAVGVPVLRDATLAGVWDTQGGNGFWSLGAASGLNTELLNADNDSVNFAVAEGSSFKIFAADFLGQMFVPGSLLTLSVTFADDGTADQSIIIP
jgi:hypothetical protein